MNLIRVAFDDGRELNILCENAIVSRKGVEIIGGKKDGMFYETAHEAELLARNVTSDVIKEAETIDELLGNKIEIEFEMSKGLKALKNINVLQITSKEQPPKFIRLSDVFKEDYKTIEKELKALEIIKKKNVNIKDLKNANGLADYNMWYLRYNYDYYLTQEEYDFLKEVLE